MVTLISASVLSLQLWAQQTGGDVVVDYNNPKKYIVGGVRVEGNTYFAPEQILQITGLQEGMEVTVPIFKSMLKDGTTLDDIKNIYKKKYNGPIVSFVDENDEAGFISANAYSDLDSMEIAVFGNEERIILTARYDNLGKGASGAAIECLNIVLGQDETTGLVVK